MAEPAKAKTGAIPLGKREFQPNPSVYIAQCLKEQEVEVAFGVHGGHIWQLVDEMSNAGIRIITVRHEQAAVYAAEAYSQVTGKPGVVFATVGPGTGNVASAVQQAYMSCSPIVLFLGGHNYEHDGIHVQQESYAEKLLGGITKWTRRLVHPVQFKRMVTLAFKEAQEYPRGPVALELSLTSLQTPIPPAARPGVYGEHAYYVHGWRGADTCKPMTVGGDPQLVEKAVKLACEAERPSILAGDGAHWSRASEELTEFVDLTQMPVTGRQLARGVVPEVHPLCVSGGVAFDGCDLVLAIGARSPLGLPNAPYIQINESPRHIRAELKTALGIVGSPNVVLRQMNDYIKANKIKPSPARLDRARRIADAQKAATARLNAKGEKYRDHKPIHVGYLSKVLWDICEERYGGMNRIVEDGWTISAFAPPFVRARYSGQVLTADGQAGVGHGIGMVIGACFGDAETRNKPIVALMGDAGIGLAGMDIETAARYRLPVVYLVTNNNGWLTAMKYMHYGKDWEGMGPQDREMGQECLPDIRYDRMFKEVGCHGEWVTEPAQIRPALERAFRSAEKGKPALVNVKVDPTITNPLTFSYAFSLSWMHVPWDKLPQRGKAMRRAMRNFPWEELGIPPMPVPDPWEPITEEEMRITPEGL